MSHECTDNKPCPMCPMEIRNLCAVVHNLAWRLTPGSASVCKVVSKFHDMKAAVERVQIAEDTPPEIRKLYEAAKAASECKTLLDLYKHEAALTAASLGVEALSDAHFANEAHWRA